MRETTTVSINGQLYDALTGLPVSHAPATVHHAKSSVHAPNHTPAKSLHARPQRSNTLLRRVTKRPEPTPKHAIVQRPQHVTHVAEVKRHHEVKKFAPHPVGAVQPAHPSGRRMMDIGPARHPHVAKAHAKSEAKAAPKPVVTAESIKERAIKKAVEKTHKRPMLKGRLLPKQRLVGALSAIVALVLFGAYLTYLNMPNLSVRVAAIQAGLDADYPNYRPDGYALSGPVMFSDGRVAMKFAANAGPHQFTITQSRSDWNNEAVLDNYVNPKAGTNYIPYSERGLVIYTYGNNAAWVNGGILYTVEGDAPLSSEQIRRIATSLL